MHRRQFLKASSTGCVALLPSCSSRSAPSSNLDLGADNSVTLDDLVAIDTRAAEQFPSNSDAGLGRLGLILIHDQPRYDYASTPKNATSFATTGGAGAHFSFVDDGTVELHRRPIVLTVPMSFGNENFIVGESLHDFLCLGYYRGYFALEQLAYYYDTTIDAFSSPDWQATEEWHHSVGFILDDYEKKVLGYLIEQLDLSPWADVRGKLTRLKASHFSKLQLKLDE